MAHVMWKGAVVEVDGKRYHVRLPTDDADDAKRRIAKRGWTFIRFLRRGDEKLPNYINRLYPE